MARFTLAKEHHHLAEPLSRRLAEMRWGFKNAIDLGIPFEREEMEALVDRVADMSASARDLEDAARQRPSGRRHVNPDVAPISEALCQLEDAARAARRLVADRINEVETDPDGAIGAEIAKAAKALLTVAALVRNPSREVTA